MDGEASVSILSPFAARSELGRGADYLRGSCSDELRTVMQDDQR